MADLDAMTVDLDPSVQREAAQTLQLLRDAKVGSGGKPASAVSPSHSP